MTKNHDTVNYNILTEKCLRKSYIYSGIMLSMVQLCACYRVEPYRKIG